MFSFQECFFTGSIHDCDNFTPYLDIFIALSFIVPVLYHFVSILRQYIIFKADIYKLPIFFFYSCSFVTTFFSLNSIYPSALSLSTHVTYVHQIYVSLIYILTHLYIADRSIQLLVLLNSKYSLFFSYFIKSLIYLNQILIIISIYIIYGTKFSELLEKTDKLISLIFIFEPLSRGIFLISNSYVFLFFSRINKIYSEKDILIMKIIIIIFSFSSIIFLILFYTNSNKINPFYLFGLLDNFKYANLSIYLKFFFNLFGDYIPRFLFAISMWLLSLHDSEEVEELDVIDYTLNIE